MCRNATEWSELLIQGRYIVFSWPIRLVMCPARFASLPKRSSEWVLVFFSQNKNMLRNYCSWRNVSCSLEICSWCGKVAWGRFDYDRDFSAKYLKKPCITAYITAISEFCGGLAGVPHFYGVFLAFTTHVQGIVLKHKVSPNPRLSYSKKKKTM